MSGPGNETDTRFAHRDRAPDLAEGTTIDGDGMGGPVDEESGFPATNLVTLPTDDRWRTTGTEPAKTRAHFELDGVHELGMDLLGAYNLSEAALFRVTRDVEFAERWSLDLSFASGEVETAVNITPTLDYTLMFWQRIDLKKWNGLSCRIAFLGTADVAADREFLVTIGPTGQYFFVSSRFSGSSNSALSPGTPALDGQFHHLTVVMSGGGTTATLYVDGVFAASVTEADPLVATVSKLQFFGTAAQDANVIAGSVAYFTRGLGASEVLATYKKALIGTEPSLELLWHIDEGAGLVLADETGNAHAGTIGGGAVWTRSMVNPAANYSSGILEVWQPYETRTYLSFDGVSDGARTGTNLSASLSMSCAVWVFRPALLSSSAIFCDFGTGNTESTREFLMRFEDTGDISCFVFRYTSTNSSFGNPVSAGWHRCMVSIDGVNDEAIFYIDGAAVGSPFAIDPADLTQVAERFALGATTSQTANARCFISGDVIIWNRVVTPADDPTYTRLAPEADPTVLLHYTLEDEVSPILNRGTAGSGGDLVLTGGTWKTDGQSPVNPDGEWLEGEIPGPKSLLRALGFDVLPTLAQFVLLEIWDVDNEDGFVEIGRFATYQTYDYLAGESASTAPIRYTRSRSGYASRDAGTSLRTGTTPVMHTDREGRAVWRSATRRAERSGHPVLVVAFTASSWVEIAGGELVVYGLPVESAGGISSGLAALPSHPYKIVLAVEEIP